jgi:hypothetical protein
MASLVGHVGTSSASMAGPCRGGPRGRSVTSRTCPGCGPGSARPALAALMGAGVSRPGGRGPLHDLQGPTVVATAVPRQAVERAQGSRA